MASRFNQYNRNGAQNLAQQPPPPPGYSGAIPEIAQAYQNDPMTRMAANALTQGTSTAPVAGGKYAWMDGLSRVGQAILGKVVDDKQRKKYAAEEAKFGQAFGQTADMASGNPGAMAVPNPGQAPSGAAMAAQALAPPQGPAAPPPSPMAGRVDVPQPGAVRPVDMPPSEPAQAAAAALAGPQSASPPPMPGGPSMVPSQRPAVPVMPNMVEGGSAPFTQGGTGPNRGAVRPQAQPAPAANARDLYFKGIVPIEGGTDRNGRFLTSPKGAIGPGQVMPGTAPEAARLAHKMGLINSPRLNDSLYRTDAGYNNALGMAYYAKQLETFGDPVKAAAAYNAGPGGVQRAMRRAARTGKDWTAHLPAETQKYVVNFQSKVGSNAGVAGDGGAAPMDVPQLQMEQVPDRPAPPPSQMPDATPVPQEVVSNRIGMAQQMLKSGNPYMVAIARQYLDKGLEEQFNSRQVQNSQQFQQNQNRDNTALGDWSGARQDERRAGYDAATAAEARNFTRETTNNRNAFDIANREDTQAYGRDERIAGQDWQSGEAQKQRDWTSGENRLERETKVDVAGLKQQQRSAYWTSPSGLKMRDAHNDEIKQIDDTIGKVDQFLTLNERTGTGGAMGYLSGPAGVVNPDIAVMKGIANDATLAKIGGSLGTAISDGDRKFIMDSGLGVDKPGSANRQMGQVLKGSLNRRKDYLYEFGNAEADGPDAARQFQNEWRAFVNSDPIVKRDRRGRVIGIVDTPLTFQAWKASRRKFGADGREIK